MTISYFHNIRNAVVASTQGSTAENCNKISTNKSLRTRIKKVATVSLIFGSVAYIAKYDDMCYMELKK